MKALLEIYWTQFKTVMATQLQYRVEVSLWMLGAVLQPVVYIVVWSSVISSRGTAIQGYSQGDIAAYFIVVMLLNHATMSWVIFGLSDRIRKGWLSAILLRPVHPIHGDIAENLSYKAVTLAIMLPAAALMIGLFRPTLPLAPWMVALFVPAVLLAFVLRFLLEWTIGLGALWTTRMTAVNQLYDVALIFLSGQVAPLSLFPAPVQTLAMLLPFRWIIAFPAELLLGRLTLGEAIVGLGAQIGWLALILVVFACTWRVGIRRYSAVGA